MSRDVLKISESASVTELTSILTRHRITGLPVLDSKGKPDLTLNARLPC